MDPEAARSFARRAYDVVAESKETYWAQQFRERGAEATWRAGQALREHAKRVRPDWPCEDDRARDLEHHVALIALLERVCIVRINSPDESSRAGRLAWLDAD